MPQLSADQASELAREIERVAAVRLAADQAHSVALASLESLVASIREARASLDTAATKVVSLAQELRKAKQDPALASAHHMYVSGHIRLAGAVQQAVRRTTLLDRVLVVAKAQQQEDARRAQDQDIRNQNKAFQARLAAMSDNPLDELADLLDEELP